MSPPPLSRSVAFAAFLLAASTPALASDYPPADHGGGDLTLLTGDRIWGTHTGIGRFVVPDGEVAAIRPYSPTIPETGGVAIYAAIVEIDGELDGNAAGFTGGGGGAGMPPGVGGAGSYSGFVGGVGSTGGGDCVQQWTGFPGTYGFTNQSNGRSGDGPAKGTGALGAFQQYNSCTGSFSQSSGFPARSGGYGTLSGENNDVSTDASIMMGSGGGGGSEVGQGGGNGGGMIRIVPSATLILGAQSTISVDGAWGAFPTAPNGGNSLPPVYSTDGAPTGQSRGGAGSGGGICIDLTGLTSEDDLIVERGAAISSITPADSRSSPPSGGTIKIMRDGLPFSNQIARLTLTSSRCFMSGSFANSSAENWQMYE